MKTFQDLPAVGAGIGLEDRDLACLCKALAHPARIKILKQLLHEDRCICGRIVEVLPLAQSTVSQHLKILKQAGLVQGEVAGPRTCYCVDKERLLLFANSLGLLVMFGGEQNTHEQHNQAG